MTNIDILVRLREAIWEAQEGQLIKEAADEIERLREENNKLRELLTDQNNVVAKMKHQAGKHP